MRPTKVCLIAAMALALVAAHAAPALATGGFEAEAFPVMFSGEQTATHTFALGETKVECKHATLKGEAVEPPEKAKLLPEYTECTSLGSSATVKANGCEYEFGVTEETEENKFTGTTGIVCPEGKKITFSLRSGKCEATIGSQSGLAKVTYKDSLEAKPPTVTFEQSASSIHYTVTSNKESCFPGTGEKTNGSLTGNSLVKGSIEGEADAIAVTEVLSTKLCKKAPAAKTAKCAAGEAFPLGTEVLGELGAGEKVTMFLFNGAPVDAVDCEKSTFFARSEKAEGKPLKLENVSLSFASCSTFKASTPCAVVMVNSPTKASLFARGKLQPGNGLMFAAIRLFFECGAEYKCEYAAARELFDWFGGATPLISTLGNPSFKHEPIAGEFGCTPTIELGGKYTVAEPKPLWVTF